MEHLRRPRPLGLLLAALLAANATLPVVAGAEPETGSQAPAPAPAPVPSTASTDVHSIIEEIQSVFYDELQNSPRQWLNALVAVAFGITLVIDGKRFFEGFICAGVGIVVMFMAMNVVTNLWDLGYYSVIRHVVGVEVGLMGAYSAWKGIAGMNVFVGALLGFLLAMSLQGLLVHVGAGFMDSETGNKWVLICFYTVFVLILVAVLNTERHLRLLAILSPALGGAFVSSGVSYGVASLALAGHLDFLKAVIPDLHPVSGTWVEFLMLLKPWTSQIKDVGVFAGSKYNTMGAMCTLDRICGWIFWFILWVVGMLVQLRSWKRKTQPARARELEQQLLQTEQGLRP
mmetsp:Transcript_22562/g.65013  ORF Transcript_22562/g.65013 Transcript_22562/m.65013 type:complete len:344 (+) Transcript_22562:71-1102(+)